MEIMKVNQKKSKKTEDCEYLSGKICKLLEEDCFALKKKQKQRCAFSDHYKFLSTVEQGNAEAERIKSEVKPEALERWKDFTKGGTKAGRKDMTGITLERGVRSAIQRVLDPLGVHVTDKGEKHCFHDKSVTIIADCLTSKDKHPTSIISIKTWLTPEAIRETFAYAYLAKHWYGQRNYRVFMVALSPIWDNLKGLIDAFTLYIDGVYSLSGEPYIDDLLKKLKEIYV